MLIIFKYCFVYKESIVIIFKLRVTIIHYAKITGKRKEKKNEFKKQICTLANLIRF